MLLGLRGRGTDLVNKIAPLQRSGRAVLEQFDELVQHRGRQLESFQDAFNIDDLVLVHLAVGIHQLHEVEQHVHAVGYRLGQEQIVFGLVCQKLVDLPRFQSATQPYAGDQFLLFHFQRTIGRSKHDKVSQVVAFEAGALMFKKAGHGVC